MSQEDYIAHFRQSDGTRQSLAEHATGVATRCSQFAEAVGLPLCGRLLGLIHDWGKYSLEFKVYLLGVCGLQGEEMREHYLQKQGTIDHATAGAQLLWERLGSQANPRAVVLGQILAVAVMSHHSRKGMKDFIALDGSSPFLRRLQRPDDQTHCSEAMRNADQTVREEIEALLASPQLQAEFDHVARAINRQSRNNLLSSFSFGLLTRFLFSCLLDADRLDTADFENEKAARFRSGGKRPDWNRLRDKLETYLTDLPDASSINSIRNAISDACRSAASHPQRLLTLTVPTGGGKTLASLRFALHRAAKAMPDRVDRIIFVIPYTSIIDQNACKVAEILGDDTVLEHHSNLTPDRDTWKNRVLSENWDAPVVFTTSVQFLDCLFNQSTRTARRMHQLAHSIIVFDEIQTLPIKTFHLFCNAINFLTAHCHSTVLLCTATMPQLQAINSENGHLELTLDQEIIPQKSEIFRALKRTEIIDHCRIGGWSYCDINQFAKKQLSVHGSVLIVCNTKDAAQKIYELAKDSQPEATIIHLSTNLCPAHRKTNIQRISALLNASPPQPVICISTQLIEAGVDLDFGCVIRSLAGLDSIIQAGGRCNRHQHRKTGPVYILNFSEEKLFQSLAEIEAAQKVTLRILNDFRDNPSCFDGDLLSESAMIQYYLYAYHQRKEEMNYPLKVGECVDPEAPPILNNTSLLKLLSQNENGIAEAEKNHIKNLQTLKFHQAFSTAAQAFKVIDAPTTGFIVPYYDETSGFDGRKVIGELAAVLHRQDASIAEKVALLRTAQQYTVNVFPHALKKLQKNNALKEIVPGSGIYHLDEYYYDKALGVTHEATSERHYCGV